jgi:hypothetical protein
MIRVLQHVASVGFRSDFLVHQEVGFNVIEYRGRVQQSQHC